MAMTKPDPRKPPPSREPTHLSKRGLIISGIVAGLLVTGALATIYARIGPTDSRPMIGGPFTLLDSTGHTVSNTAWPGQYLLVYFGYTYCPDVCPTTLNEVAGALDKLGPEAKRLQPLFITVDPARDTPSVMATYTAAFTPRLVGLTGTPDQIAQVAREYRVYYAKHKTGPGPDDYTMDHSSVLYLMAPNGKFIAVIGADQQADAMAAQIAKLIS
jgi:protein SCO1/2